MGLQDKGLDFVRQFKLPKVELWKGVVLTNDHVADSFQCSLACDQVKVLKGKTLDPLASRARGLPHMPDGLDWPDGTYLAAQLNLAEIAAFGLWDFFPSEGTAYLFFDSLNSDFHPFSPSASQTLVTGNDAPRTLREAPSKEKLPGGGKYYLEHFLAHTYALTMRPMFSIGFADVLPAALLEGLEAELGFPLGEATNGDIGGEPQTYQGEDADELFAPPDWDWSTGMPPSDDRFLLFQDSFGEGAVHFWVRREELRAGKPVHTDTTYSGT